MSKVAAKSKSLVNQPISHKLDSDTQSIPSRRSTRIGEANNKQRLLTQLKDAVDDQS